MLGRFIVPVARLDEFEAVFAELPIAKTGDGFANWRLSAVLGSNPVVDVARVREFNAGMASLASEKRAIIESVEVKVANPAEIARLSEIIPNDLRAYFEFPVLGCAEFISAIALSGRRAKIRMGGETADKFPAAESVIEFIRLCANSSVCFKATAGLHHPLRSAHRFTYQPDSPSGIMHGFLNTFLAAAFSRAGMEAEVAVQLLQEQSVLAFRFDVEGVGWRQNRLSRKEIADARAEFAVSFGSCSFTEPIDDLRSLHLL
jgi:hypothetical protein